MSSWKRAGHLMCGCVVTLLAWGSAAAQNAEPATGQQEARATELEINGESTTVRYLLFVPESDEDQEGLPLMLFLHGAGERGDDIEVVKKWGPPRIVEEDSDFPFIVVSPQCDEEKRWDADTLAHLIDHLTDELPVDKSRMYVTGLSMGGYGTWTILARHPNLFAAAIPICGGGDPDTVENFVHVPIWVFHGDADTVVTIERSRVMVDALKSAGGDVKFTEYKDVGHNSWSETYGNEEIYTWLLSHRRSND